MAKETHVGQRYGDTGNECYQRDVEACKNVFVTKEWLIGVMVALFGIYGATIYFYVKHEDSQDARIEQYHGIAIDSANANNKVLRDIYDAVKKKETK
jgi:hypothetical protein